MHGTMATMVKITTEGPAWPSTLRSTPTEHGESTVPQAASKHTRHHRDLSITRRHNRMELRRADASHRAATPPKHSAYPHSLCGMMPMYLKSFIHINNALRARHFVYQYERALKSSSSTRSSI